MLFFFFFFFGERRHIAVEPQVPSVVLRWCFFFFPLVLFEVRLVGPTAFCIYCLIVLSLSPLCDAGLLSQIAFLLPRDILCEEQSEETVDLTEAWFFKISHFLWPYVVFTLSLSNQSHWLNLHTPQSAEPCLKCRWSVCILCMWMCDMLLLSPPSLETWARFNMIINKKGDLKW